MSIGKVIVAAEKLLSQKRLTDGIKNLTKKGTEKLTWGNRFEIGKKAENLYPGLKWGTLPDSLAHLETHKPSLKEISAERQGVKLTTDVAQRLWDEKITPRAWENADFEGRKQMLLNAKQIMGQEMLLSPGLRQSLKINVTENLGKKSNFSGRLVKENGRFKIENPKIEIDSDFLKNGEFESVLETMYYEMMRSMQMDSFSNAKPFSKEARIAKDSIGKEINLLEDSLNAAIKNEACGQAHVFKITYQMEGQKHPAEIVLKSKGVEQKREFATSTELHADKIGELFKQRPELQYNQWTKMDINQRLHALQGFENDIAKIECRNSAKIYCENLSPNTNGYYTRKADGSDKIALSSKLVNSDSFGEYKQCFKTLLHEGRHAYQDYNFTIMRTESSDELISQWKFNRESMGYQKPDASLMGYYRYCTQPVEYDSRLFAEAGIKKMGL